VACALIVYSYFEIQNALPKLAEMAPGNGAQRGVALSLWISLAVDAFVCGTFLLVPLVARTMPEAVHFGWRRLSDYTPRQLENVLPVVTRMVGMMSLAASMLLGYVIHMRIESALKDLHAHPPLLLVYGTLLGSLILITHYYGDRMDEAAGEA